MDIKAEVRVLGFYIIGKLRPHIEENKSSVGSSHNSKFEF